MPALTIQTKQLGEIQTSRDGDFRLSLVAHLRETLGAPFTAQSDQDVLSFIDQALARAQHYGATENNVRGMFVVVTAELGDGFDTNPAYPWAREALTDTGVKDPNRRIQNLAALCGFYLSNLSTEGSPS